MVFQRPLLLDRTALQNAALGLEIRGVGRTERERVAKKVLEQLGATQLGDRPAIGLSGGEAQRVSLARALAVSPDLLFLDEPFAALDAPTRESLISDLARAVRERGTTTLFVTHDRDEALSLADRVAVLIGGSLRQIDRAETVFAMPADEEVAAFVGVENVLPSRVESTSEELTRLRVGARVIEATALPPAGDDSPLLCVAPDDVVLSREAPSSSARNAFEATIVRIDPIGRRIRVTLDSGFPLIAHITRRSARELALAPGDRVIASFKATVPHLLPRHRRK